MRILHLDAYKEMRGGQWQVLRLIEGLEKAGVESTLLARESGPLYRAARGRGWGATWAAGFYTRAGTRIARCGCTTATGRRGWAISFTRASGPPAA